MAAPWYVNLTDEDNVFGRIQVVSEYLRVNQARMSKKEWKLAVALLAELMNQLKKIKK